MDKVFRDTLYIQNILEMYDIFTVYIPKIYLRFTPRYTRDIHKVSKGNAKDIPKKHARYNLHISEIYFL